MPQFENVSFAYLIALGLTGPSAYCRHFGKPLNMLSGKLLTFEIV